MLLIFRYPPLIDRLLRLVEEEAKSLGYMLQCPSMGLGSKAVEEGDKKRTGQESILRQVLSLFFSWRTDRHSNVSLT